MDSWVIGRHLRLRFPKVIFWLLKPYSSRNSPSIPSGALHLMTKYLSLHYLRSKLPTSPQSGKFNIFATTTTICNQTSHLETNHKWGLHCNQILFPAFVLKIETFLEWLQLMPAIPIAVQRPMRTRPIVISWSLVVGLSLRHSVNLLSIPGSQTSTTLSDLAKPRTSSAKITFSRHF